MPAARKHESAAQRQAAYRARRKTRGDSATSVAAGAVYRRWEAMRKQALSILEQIAGEMEVYSDQRSEAWRDSNRGEAFAEMMESVAEIVEAVKEVPSHLSEA